jgi:hypothetical protein
MDAAAAARELSRSSEVIAYGIRIVYIFSALGGRYTGPATTIEAEIPTALVDRGEQFALPPVG